MPIRRLVHNGTELTNAAQTLVTFGSNLVEGGALFMGGVVVNRDDVAHQVSVHFVPVGASPTESNCVYDRLVPARRHRYLPGPFHGDSGAFVSAISDDADSNVGIRVTCVEEKVR